MGIIKPDLILPKEALSICTLVEGLYLETEDGYITEDTYKPENMCKVKALITSDSFNNSNGNERLLIDYIREFAISFFDPSNNEKINNIMALTKDKGMGNITFSYPGKQFGFTAIRDVCTFEQIIEIFNNKSLDEQTRKKELGKISCLMALKNHIDTTN